MNKHMCGYSFGNSFHCTAKAVKRTTMSVTVNRPNVSITYKNVIEIKVQDDGAVRMVNKDDEIFVTRGKYEIEVED